MHHPVTDMCRMFEGYPGAGTGVVYFNEDISGWDVSNVTDMSSMFAYNGTFNQNISRWNVSHVTTMASMFNNALSYNQPMTHWNTTLVRDFSSMFSRAGNFDQDLSNWVITYYEMASSSADRARAFMGIFKDSGLSKQNYCALMNTTAWAKAATDSNLGIEYDCSTLDP